MTDDSRIARIELDLVRHNLAAIQEKVRPAQVMAVVKADGYGHGAIGIARAARDMGIGWLGTADIAEALALRRVGIGGRILCWLHPVGADFAAAALADVELGISSLEHLEHAAAVGARVHLKMDTGLSRNGFAAADVERAVVTAAHLHEQGRITVEGVFSHLANASPKEDDAQRSRLIEVADLLAATGLAPVRHLASTEAALLRPEFRLDLVRAGIGVYGLPASDQIDPAAWGLRPVMTLMSSVAAVREVPADTGVSYDYTFRTSGASRLALVPLGYADGVPRAASGRGCVLVGGRRVPIVGRIAMDQFVVEVTGLDVQVGDAVIIWGDGRDGAPTVAEWADWAETIPYEIVSRLGRRVHRLISS